MSDSSPDAAERRAGPREELPGVCGFEHGEEFPARLRAG